MNPVYTRWHGDIPVGVTGNGKQLRCRRDRLELIEFLGNCHARIRAGLTYAYLLLQSTIRCKDDAGVAVAHRRVLVGSDNQHSIAVALKRLNGQCVAKVTTVVGHGPCTVGCDGNLLGLLVGAYLDVTALYLQNLLGRLGLSLVIALAARETCHQWQCGQYCKEYLCFHIFCGFRLE